MSAARFIVSGKVQGVGFRASARDQALVLGLRGSARNLADGSVDILAVGDAAFQRKCLGKMGEVAADGRTVLFVSHDMGAVTRLCRRVIRLEAGRLVEDGAAHEVTRHYLRSDQGTSAARVWT